LTADNQAPVNKIIKPSQGRRCLSPGYQPTPFPNGFGHHPSISAAGHSRKAVIDAPVFEWRQQPTAFRRCVNCDDPRFAG
jgi:hypothetical protein